ARRVGIELEKRVEVRERNRRRDTLFEMNLWAAVVYHRGMMNTDEGRPGREYLASRGLTESTWKTFRLGYAPDAWDFLLGLGGGKGYAPSDLAAGGLVLDRQGGRGFYDRFRSRAIFPIFDVRDRVVGFGGRALDDATPKYLNSPETGVFSKSTCLYGLNAAKEGMLREKRAVVVEGYTDCLMAHQHGVDWVVATLGTALTSQHVGTLRRYADEVLLVFDGDDAGRSAAERSVDLFLEEDVDVRVVLLPADQDPCDVLVSEGRDAFVKRLAESTDVFDLKMEMIGKRHDLSRVRGREAAIEEVLETLAKTNPLRQDMLFVRDTVKRLCHAMDVTEKSLRERLMGMVRRKRSGGTIPAAPQAKSRAVEAQKELLGAVLSDASLAGRFASEVHVEDFSDEVLARIAGAVLAVAGAGVECDVNRVCARLEDESLTQVTIDLYHESAAKGKEEACFDAALQVLRNEGRRHELEGLRRELAEARSSGDEQREVELLKRHQDLMK
ncbi:MAG TPA: DNA primase, partial [Planctomycetota bacterium]|nr:DNA primase [Planctomycetota bacterium]